MVGPEQKTIITLDLDLYSRALKIQQTTGNTNWVLRAGGLHIAFAALHALGKTIEASGIDICAIESGIYTSAALRGIFGGKAYKRGLEYHITTCLAILQMLFDFTSHTSELEDVKRNCSALLDALHSRDPGMVGMFETVQNFYIINIKPREAQIAGELTKFLFAYVDQVENLLQFVSACRAGNWEEYLAALESMVKYFYARDLLNYARLMPVYLAQMASLETESPETWQALKEGDFVVSKSEVPSTKLFTDQTLEQEIKGLKRHGGMVGLSQDEGALDRLITTLPLTARLVAQYLATFPNSSLSVKRKEHYQLSGDMSVRMSENATRIRESIELHCEGNPFVTKTPLKSIVSSALIPKDAKDDVIQYANKGQTRFEEFVKKRLLPTSKATVWDPMKKLKLKSFSNYMGKTKVRLGDKVVKLREERQLFGRFLIIQGSRPELVPKLEETIGQFEMSVVPRSLFAVDGTLYIPSDKSSLMNILEGFKTDQSEAPQHNCPDYTLHNYIIFDNNPLFVRLCVHENLCAGPYFRRK